MRSIQFSIFVVILFISASLFAQKVHYKDKYYTLVNHKIFHRGYNVYAKLTEGQKDTIYMIATELYNERGKLKPKYKKRRGSSKYKLPEGYWEQKEKELAQNSTTNGIALSESTSNPTRTEMIAKAATVAANEPLEKEQEEEVIDHKTFSTKSTEKEVFENAKAGSENTKESNKIKDSSQETEARKTNSSGNHNKEKSDKKTNQKAEKQLKEKEKSASNNIEKQKKQAERSVEKANEKLDRTVKEVEKQQAKLEKRERAVEKTEKSYAKKQKNMVAKEAAIAATTVTLASKKSANFGTIYFKINKEKTAANQHGDILLFFDVINNSDKDLVILKPNNSVDNRIDFFSNSIECANVPPTKVVDIAEEAEVTEKDFVTIPANSKIEFFMNGKYQNELNCNAEDVVIQLQYNPFKDADKGITLTPYMRRRVNKVLEKITPIKIESENVKFKLNKQ